MKKIFVILSLLIFSFISSNAIAIYGNYDDFSVIEEEEKEVQKILPAGMFVRGYIGQTVSSEFNNSGDIIKILITSDFIMNNEVILPKNSYFIGTVKNLEKAQQGRDGMFSIDVVGLILSDGRYFETRGHILNGKSEAVFGGAFSRRSGHKMTLHRSVCFGNRGVMQLQQNGPRMIGKETKINMGDFVTIILDAPIDLK